MRIYDTLTLIALCNAKAGWIWYTNDRGDVFAYHAACIQQHWSIIYYSFEDGYMFEHADEPAHPGTCYVCGGNMGKPFELALK